MSNFTYFYNREMVQGDLESTNANHVRSCPYMPMQKSLLQDEGQSSLDGNDRLTSSSDLHSTHTDNQSAKHTLERLEENSVLTSKEAGRLVTIKSPTKEPVKRGETNLRERTVDHPEPGSSSASVHFNQSEDQLNAVLTSSPGALSKPSPARERAKTSGEQSDNLAMNQQTSKLNKSNLKTESYGEAVPKNVYVNVDNQSSRASTSTKSKSKSDYI